MTLTASSSSTRPLNFAVIGCGQLAFRRHLGNLAASDRAVLHTCCDVSEEALERCQRTFGVERVTRDFREAINDPAVDAICLATTEKLRLPVIEAAANAGKPVYVEKPVAATLEELYRIQKVVRDAGILLSVGHNRRFSPAMRAARDIFRAHMDAPTHAPWRFRREPDLAHTPAHDGAGCMSVRINDDWWSWKGWVFDKSHNAYGPMLFEMTHFTDLCNWFLNAAPRRVTGLGDGVLNHGVVIEYDTGELATITMTANGTFGYPKELYEAFGHGAAVIVDQMVEVRTAGIDGAPARLTFPLEDDCTGGAVEGDGIAGFLARRRWLAEQAAARGESLPVSGVEADKGHAHALNCFIDAVLGGDSPICDIDSAALATRVAFAAIRAVEQRRVVELSEV